MFLASSVGAAGGIGGGGIIVPLLVAVGGFGVHHAIPLTQVRSLNVLGLMFWVMGLGGSTCTFCRCMVVDCRP